MYKIDLHVHTLASGHAYSTIKEYIDWGKSIDMELIGFSDHGPAMPGGPDLFHLGNQIVIPRVIEGITILRGAEANILSVEGAIDIPDKYLKRIDYCIASLHDVVMAPLDAKGNTDALLETLKNPYVDIIGHSGNPKFPIDIERFVKGCHRENKVIEINNSSFVSGSRSGSKAYCYAIAECANAMGVKMILGSDSHIAYALGGFEQALQLIENLGIQKELIINHSKNSLKAYFESRGRDVSEWV